jgi:hypothetical protein
MTERPTPYPLYGVAIRWFLGATHLIVATYLAAQFKLILAVAYAILAAITLGFLYPYIRCRHCPYHGVRCNAGWGWFAAWIVPAADGDDLFEAYDLGFLTHLIWLVPFAFIALVLLGSRKPEYLIASGVYVVVVLLELFWRRFFGCRRCELKWACPALHYYRHGGKPPAG